MKERPIILAAWEVRAIIAGTKTRITRPIVPQPDKDIDGEPYWYVGGFRAWQYRPVTDVLRKGGNTLKSPFGEPGDVLWCKETWMNAEDAGVFYRSDDLSRIPITVDGETRYDDYSILLDYHKWRSSTTMPRWASRIALRVETESVGRVQDIRDADAVAEGFVAEMLSAAEELEIMWDCIYAKRGLGYAVNPWCYSATFVRVAPRVEGSDRP